MNSVSSPTGVAEQFAIAEAKLRAWSSVDGEDSTDESYDEDFAGGTDSGEGTSHASAASWGGPVWQALWLRAQPLEGETSAADSVLAVLDIPGQEGCPCSWVGNQQVEMEQFLSHRC